jgi:hypothetical protein
MHQNAKVPEKSWLGNIRKNQTAKKKTPKTKRPGAVPGRCID